MRRRGEVVLQERHLQVGQEFGAFADEVGAAAQEVTGGPHRLGVDVGLGESAAAQEAGQLPGVDGVGLGLAAVDRLEVERVAQDEGDALGGAQVGQPVPGEQALAADHQAVAVRGQGRQESVGLRRQGGFQGDRPGGVEDAQRQGPGVQVDAAVESVLAGVEPHRHGLRGVGRPESCRSWRRGTHRVEIGPR